MDKEKVIRAVDSCFDYWLEQHRCLLPLELENVRQLKADALALLKEQEAVKPRILYTVERHCGYCDKIIEDGWTACPWCGRSISFRCGEAK